MKEHITFSLCFFVEAKHFIFGWFKYINNITIVKSAAASAEKFKLQKKEIKKQQQKSYPIDANTHTHNSWIDFSFSLLLLIASLFFR